MEAEKDLDDLLAAHEKYLLSIREKSLLGERSNKLSETLFVLSEVILQFRSLADRLFEGILELQTRSVDASSSLIDKRKLVSGKSSSEPGSWAIEGRKVLSQQAGKFLGLMEKELVDIANRYSSLFKEFISQLPLQQHVDLKFLLFLLDFNEFYSRSRQSLPVKV